MSVATASRYRREAVDLLAVLLAWPRPGRVRSDAACAAPGGASPLPASSGDTTRYRLHRGGDRRLHRALHTVAPGRVGHDPHTRDHVTGRTAGGQGRSAATRNRS
ncbi:transposase [Micromonospora sp. NBC_00421]|uniref:transposase n=1 Tax=Micromonospora sp. NBC_00421 TaxID=2975976 RepID=UPI003FA5250B